MLFLGSLLISKSLKKHCWVREIILEQGKSRERCHWQGWQGADGSYSRQAGENHDVIMRTGTRINDDSLHSAWEVSHCSETSGASYKSHDTAPREPQQAICITQDQQFSSVLLGFLGACH